MKRRQINQIQVPDQIPHNYDAVRDKDYSALVPDYTTNAKIKQCSDDTYITTTDDVNIVCNSIYDYDAIHNSESGDSFDGIYHRDNYCMVPYYVPPMMFEGTSYPLNKSVLDKLIPNVSTSRVSFDRTVWFSTDNFWPSDDDPDANGSNKSFVNIVTEAFPSFVDILDAGFCHCDAHGSYQHYSRYPDYENDPGLHQCGPLDVLPMGNLDITDEYIYAWSDGWDMNITMNKNSYKSHKKDEEEEDTTDNLGPCMCRILPKEYGTDLSMGIAWVVKVVAEIGVDGDGEVTVRYHEVGDPFPVSTPVSMVWE